MPKFRRFIQKQKNIITLIILIFLSILLIIFSKDPVVASPNEIGMSFFSVCQTAITSVVEWIGDVINSIGKLEELKKELEETQNELLKYQRTTRDNAKLRQENQELYDQMELRKKIEYEHIPVKVIAWGTENNFSTIIINKGSIDGIKRNMPIVAFQGGLQGLVGRVIAVGINSSVVLTLVDPSSYVSAQFQGSGYWGIINGCGAFSEFILMENVKKRAIDEVNYGDLIITSGLGKLYPYGIAIGRWRKVHAKEYESTLTFEIEPIIDFSRLKYLYILKVSQ